MRDVNPEVMRLSSGFLTPHFSQKLPMRQHFAGVSDEQAQQ